MKNYYEALGVAQSATPSVVKIAYEGKLKALQRSGLDEAARKAEEKLLTEAHVTLSNPAKKAWYDSRLEEHHAKQEKASGAGGRQAMAIAAGVVALLVGATVYYFDSRSKERERLRLEEQRIALEREKAARQAEIERARLDLERERAASASTGSRERTDAVIRVIRDGQSESSRRFDRVMDHAEQREAAAQEARSRSEQRLIEDRARRQADEDLRKARAEVERQKRFVAEREREEERIRTDRANRARYGR